MDRINCFPGEKFHFRQVDLAYFSVSPSFADLTDSSFNDNRLEHAKLVEKGKVVHKKPP